jgi:putative hydrolase of HD superfamily
MNESNRSADVQSSRVASVAQLLLLAGSLKDLPRMGWRLVGIKDCESVAEHSYRVALVALVLSERVGGIDRAKLLAMAILHDLPESLVTDLPRAAVHLIGRQAKQQAERDAWAKLTPPEAELNGWRALWEEFEAGETAEAKLVRAADRLEMLFQAYEYERTGYANLATFWQDEELAGSQFQAVCELFAEVKRLRAALAGNPGDGQD